MIAWDGRERRGRGKRMPWWVGAALALIAGGWLYGMYWLAALLLKALGVHLTGLPS